MGEIVRYNSTPEGNEPRSRTSFFRRRRRNNAETDTTSLAPRVVESTVVLPQNGAVAIRQPEFVRSVETAKLPEDLYEDTLGGMRVGESVYTVPWAMAVTVDGHCYLNADYLARQQPGGTVGMLVKKTQDGYEVHIPLGNKYAQSVEMPWLGAAPEDLIPVYKLNTAVGVTKGREEKDAIEPAKLPVDLYDHQSLKGNTVVGVTKGREEKDAIEPAKPSHFFYGQNAAMSKSMGKSEPLPGAHIQGAVGYSVSDRYLAVRRERDHRPTISQLREGENAYTLPWAMAVTKDGSCYLNPDYPAEKHPHGTVEMLVTRTKKGYQVEVPAGEKYTPSRVVPWVGAYSDELLPVVGIKKAKQGIIKKYR